MRTLTMPDHSIVVPSYKLGDEVTDEQDIAYNQACNQIITTALVAGRSAGSLVPLVKTHYPFDLPDGTSDDTVSLGHEDEIVVIDTGVEHERV